MKIRISNLLLIAILLVSAASYSQMDRRIGAGQYKRPKKEKNTDFVQQSVDYLAKELKLDDFQKAAVREILEDERAHITELRQNQGKDMTRDEIRDKAKAISDRIYKKVFPLLSKEQAEIYTKMEESKKF